MRRKTGPMFLRVKSQQRHNGKDCSDKRHDGLPMQAKAINQQNDQPCDDYRLWIKTRPAYQAHQQRKGGEINQLDGFRDLKIERKKGMVLTRKVNTAKAPATKTSATGTAQPDIAAQALVRSRHARPGLPHLQSF